MEFDLRRFYLYLGQCPFANNRIEKELLRVFCGDGSGKIKALCVFTVDFLQKDELFRGFYTFSDDIHPQALREGHDRVDDIFFLLSATHGTGERSVDLQGIEREPVEVAQ